MKSNKFSVLFVTNQLIYGGAERYTISVSNELKKRGCSVAIISSGGPMKKLLNKKIKHYYAPVRETDLPSRLRTIITILYVSLKTKVQIVHTQSRQGAFAASVAKIVTRAPVIKTAHGYPDGMIPSVARALNTTTDTVIMISDWLSRRMVSFGLNKKKAKTILNGINMQEFVQTGKTKERLKRKIGLTAKDKVIVSVARVVPEKCFRELVYWFPYVLSMVPNAKLLIVGNGDADGESYRDDILKQVKRAGLDKSIILLRGTDKVADVLGIADIFCMPSVGKGFAVLEAMAAGLPVVARKPRGVADTVRNGVNGFLFATGDWKAMVEKIVFLLQNKKIAREMGNQGKLQVQSHFSLDQMIDKLEKVYKTSLISAKVESAIPLPQQRPTFTPSSKFESKFS